MGCLHNEVIEVKKSQNFNGNVSINLLISQLRHEYGEPLERSHSWISTYLCFGINSTCRPSRESEGKSLVVNITEWDEIIELS